MSETVLTGGEGFTDAVTFAFADRAAGFFGLARAGVATGADGLRGSALGVLFAGREPVGVLAEGDNALGAEADWDELRMPGLVVRSLEPRARWQVALDAPGGSGFDLEFTAVSPPAELEEDDDAARLGGMAGHEQLCRVSGTAAGHKIDCLGQRGRTWGVADWSRIALTRSLAAWLEDGTSLTVAAVRPAGAESHADEATWGALLDADGAVAVADPRVSTTYDGDGHQRRAGLELWVSEDDDYPRRGAGQMLCGSSVELGQLRLDCAFFVWQVDGREGVGRYDLRPPGLAGPLLQLLRELRLEVEGGLHRLVTDRVLGRQDPELARVLHLVEDDEVRDDPAVAQHEVVDAVELDRLAGPLDPLDRAVVGAGEPPVREDVVALLDDRDDLEAQVGQRREGLLEVARDLVDAAAGAVGEALDDVVAPEHRGDR